MGQRLIFMLWNLVGVCVAGAVENAAADKSCKEITPDQIVRDLSRQKSYKYNRQGLLVSSLLALSEAEALLSDNPAICEKLKGITGLTNSADLRTACILRYYFYKFLLSAFDKHADTQNTVELCNAFFSKFHVFFPQLPKMPGEGCELLAKAYKSSYSNVCTELALLVPPNAVFDSHLVCRTMLYPVSSNACVEVRQADFNNVCINTAVVLGALRLGNSELCGESLICRTLVSPDRGILNKLEENLKLNYCNYKHEIK